ncbi:hydroxyethylthiazole kinase [Pontibacillus halophilus JSM 076056 = DSM 19796]|uniref:Hydroxyethylthiazole kinase n=1 Tax=Pontibacillus halophilus JSM 076056 = DSM 19796 TaxID=1385510 RepID=A0A0A5GS32_9BACI|nr:hydroxyethylthiazole kinase [Pontibacillus halophilus]KGX93965.1 hydroxyethylthiazole kinase [Pontibacillus halophilus JSM 076056 = DSM 19796]
MTITALREKGPLIHNLTNEVVSNFTANGLYAIGASPVMSKAPEEAADMAGISDGVLINIGTLTASDVEAMHLAGRRANENGIPVVLDPVGVAATAYRKETCRDLLQAISFTAIRGNAGEIATLIDRPWEARGVDSSDDGDVVELAEAAAIKLGTLIILTGKKDVVTDGTRTYTCENGTPMLTKVTGTGCLLSSVVTAFLTLDGDRVDNAVSAVSTYGVASELAVDDAAGPGTFHPRFLDTLSTVTLEAVQQHAVVKEVVHND